MYCVVTPCNFAGKLVNEENYSPQGRRVRIVALPRKRDSTAPTASCVPETFMGKTTGGLRNAAQSLAFVMSVIVIGTTDSSLSSSR